MKLEALETRNGNFFVFFHEYYGAYFNESLTAFCENPVRVEALKEWGFAMETWENEPEVIELDEETSERLLELVEGNAEHGITNIRDLANEEYASNA